MNNKIKSVELYTTYDLIRFEVGKDGVTKIDGYCNHAGTKRLLVYKDHELTHALYHFTLINYFTKKDKDEQN